MDKKNIATNRRMKFIVLSEIHSAVSVKIFAKVPYPQHYDTGCLDEKSLGCIELRIVVVETIVVLWEV